MSISRETLAKLARFDTPTLCNVIELFGARPDNRGFTDGRIRASYPELPPMVGFAATASFRSDAPPQQPAAGDSARQRARGDAYGSLQAQLEQFAELPGPAVVVFQDLDDPPVGAAFGEVMCSTYQGFGAVGLVTNGAGRDIAQVRALNFPVFTGSTICSHAYCHILHVGLPVRVGGLVIHQGELLHGDANGVAAIPLDIAGEVADACDEFVAAELIVIEYARGPGPKTVAEFAARRQAFSAAVAKMKERLKRK